MPLNVLVVEDDRNTARNMETLLHRHGHHVAVTHDGTAAVARAGAEAFDTALVDVGLPDIDGYEVARQLRARSQRPLFLIAVTGFGDDEHRQRSRNAGIDLHLVKPINSDDLMRLLSRLHDIVA